MKHLNKIIIGILFLLVLVLLMSNFTLKQKSHNLLGFIELQKDSIEVWKDNYNRSHARAMALRTDRDTFLKLYEDLLKVNSSTKPKNVKSITGTSTVQERELEVPPAIEGFGYDDKWTNIKASIRGEKLYLKYSVYDSLVFMVQEERKLFKRNKYTVEAVSQNPYVKFRTLQYVEVQEKKRPFSLGLSVIYTQNGPAIGLGLHYSLIRF